MIDTTIVNKFKKIFTEDLLLLEIYKQIKREQIQSTECLLIFRIRRYYYFVQNSF